MSKTRSMLGGLKSLLPFIGDYKGTGGTAKWEYCVAVWLRHVGMLLERNVPVNPGTIVEVGPGDSVGLGVCAVMSGVEQYIGVDVVEHVDWARSASHVTSIAKAFRERAPVPVHAALDRVLPPLKDREFPEQWPWIRHPQTEKKSLAEREALLRQAIDAEGKSGVISFRCPWSAGTVVPGSADWVMSHVALQDMACSAGEPVLQRSLRSFHGWLRPGGLMTHQVDFSCPGDAPWNHHWAWSPLERRIARGRRPYYVNGLPLSGYLSLLHDTGFDVDVAYAHHDSGLGRERVAADYGGLPESDYVTSAAFLIAKKVR